MTVTLIVLDSVGVGALPDAENFGDAGSHTLDHTIEKTGMKLPNFEKLGLGNISSVHSIPQVDAPQASFGRMAEVSLGKDTTTGHWELVGLHLDPAFKTFPQDYPSFPQAVMTQFDTVTGRGHLGNYAASGTVIIEDLGPEHIKTGKPIIYTSADSVFQIAAHVDVVPLEQLYEWCEAAREILQGDYTVARVIARPFKDQIEGEAGSFQRLGAERKDYSLTPPHNVLNAIKDAGKEVISIGKIADIYNGSGITKSIKTKSNIDGIEKTIEAMKARPNGLIFTNLVEFDSLYGHRRNPQGYAQALKDTDDKLPDILEALSEDDVVIFTSDHGNDPTWHGTDHTREYALLLAYQKNGKAIDLGTRESFADVGATVAELLDCKWDGAGTSFAKSFIL